MRHESLPSSRRRYEDGPEDCSLVVGMRYIASLNETILKSDGLCVNKSSLREGRKPWMPHLIVDDYEKAVMVGAIGFPNCDKFFLPRRGPHVLTGVEHTTKSLLIKHMG